MTALHPIDVYANAVLEVAEDRMLRSISPTCLCDHCTQATTIAVTAAVEILRSLVRHDDQDDQDGTGVKQV